jgi:methionyl-tRNA formyltransferase
VRTVFLGTSDFAAAVLRRLVRSDHPPALVVTRPDRPKGRGRKVSAPPVADAARELGLELDQPESVNSDEARARIAAARPGAVCVCAFGALIREPLLSEHPMLNVHPSLLPRWRGAAPVERAIMAGDEETGVSIMQLVAELDAGPVALQRAEPIHPDDTYGSLAPRLERLGGELLVEVLDRWPVAFEAQDEAGATYAEKIGPDDRRLDPSRPAPELERTVLALSPHIGARIELPGDEPLRVHEAAVGEPDRTGEPLADAGRGAGEPERSGGPPTGAGNGAGSAVGDIPPGALVQRDGRLLFGCAGGPLELLVVQPPGGRPMEAGAYLRGHDVPAG